MVNILNGQMMAEKVPANFASELKIENDQLREALTDVLRYRRGEGEYDFSRKPEAARGNAAFDAWMTIEERIISLLSNLKVSRDHDCE